MVKVKVVLECSVPVNMMEHIDKNGYISNSAPRVQDFPCPLFGFFPGPSSFLAGLSADLALRPSQYLTSIWRTRASFLYPPQKNALILVQLSQLLSLIRSLPAQRLSASCRKMFTRFLHVARRSGNETSTLSNTLSMCYLSLLKAEHL